MCPEDRQNQKNVFLPFFQPATSEGGIQGGLATHTQTVNQDCIRLQDPCGGRIPSRKLERFAVKETMRAFQGCIDDYQTLQCEAGLIEVTGLAGFIGRKHSLGVFFCPSASLHYWHL